MNEPLTKGDKAKLVDMPQEKYPVPIGTVGTCIGSVVVQGEAIFYIEWENGRTLSLIDGLDKWEKI